jgi:acetyl-CoA synthetase
MGETLLPTGASYAEVYTRFRWQLPTTFNIGVDVCDRHADDPSRLAIIYEDDTGQVSTHTFAEFRAGSNQLAHALIRLSITRGDRVGIILSQRPETAVAHLARYKLGAIALPLPTLFGPEALDYRLRDAAAQVVVEVSDAFSPVVTAAEDSALLIYTSGTTGPPKGALQAHRVLQ